jgi:hypothetical protein
VAVLVAGVQRPQHLGPAHVVTVKMPRANAAASDWEIFTPGTPSA